MLAERFTGANGPEASGFHLLIDAREALDARLALIDVATRSIDMQYFIWKPDACGDILLDRVIKAADRGVRVRLLIDDIYL